MPKLYRRLMDTKYQTSQIMLSSNQQLRAFPMRLDAARIWQAVRLVCEVLAI